MYFIFIYELNHETEPHSEQIKTTIKNTLTTIGLINFSNPIEKTYLIHCDSVDVRGVFVNGILEYVRTKNKFKFLATPLIDSSAINAFIPKSQFDEVRNIVSSSTYGGGISF